MNFWTQPSDHDIASRDIGVVAFSYEERDVTQADDDADVAETDVIQIENERNVDILDVLSSFSEARRENLVIFRESYHAALRSLPMPALELYQMNMSRKILRGLIEVHICRFAMAWRVSAERVNRLIDNIMTAFGEGTETHISWHVFNNFHQIT